MKNDMNRLSPINLCQSSLELPTFILGKRYFSTLHPGFGTHLHISWVDGYRLVYQLLGNRRKLPPRFYLTPGARRRIDLPTCKVEQQVHQLLLSITNPEGKPVLAPQVIFTLIESNGSHRMSQGLPCSAGHSLIFEWDTPRRLRVETEVVADGCFITDHFAFEINCLLN
jgi:hypothetical protein